RIRDSGKTHSRHLHPGPIGDTVWSRMPPNMRLRVSVLRIRNGPDPVVQWRGGYLDSTRYQPLRVLARANTAGSHAVDLAGAWAARRLSGDHNRILAPRSRERPDIQKRAMEEPRGLTCTRTQNCRTGLSPLCGAAGRLRPHSEFGSSSGREAVISRT